MIVLTDPAFGRQRIDGAYDVAAPDDALEGLVRSRGGVLRRVTPWITLVSGR
jgi:transmembrane sensor